jgi:crotonobetainyl-CoA:carnitine CoA-transferase CaiB-like acyl-CoA transferase
MVVEVEHPRGGKINMIGNPVKQPEVDEQPLTPTPTLGQHTEEVLKSLLDFTDEKITELRDKKII